MEHSIQIPRRIFCLTTASTILLSIWPGPAIANRDDDLTGFKPYFSVKQFYSLTRREIRKILDGRRGRDMVIEGFSTTMSDYIFYMSEHNWAGTRRLVRDMKKIKDPKARKAKLQSEIDKAKAFIANLKASITRLTNSGGSALAIQQERERLSDTEEYLNGLETWLKFPHEGTRE